MIYVFLFEGDDGLTRPEDVGFRKTSGGGLEIPSAVSLDGQLFVHDGQVLKLEQFTGVSGIVFCYEKSSAEPRNAGTTQICRSLKEADEKFKAQMRGFAMSSKREAKQ